MKDTDVIDFISQLGGGAVENQLAKILSDVAGATVDHAKAGEITLKLTMKQISTSHQVTVLSKVSFKRPTARGSKSEEDQCETVFHVNASGLSVLPDNQVDIFTKKTKTEQ